MAGFFNKCLPKSSRGRKVLLVSVVAVTGLLIFAGLFRNAVLEKGLDRLASKVELAGYRLTWEESRFIHFNKVSVSQLLLELEGDKIAFISDFFKDTGKF